MPRASQMRLAIACVVVVAGVGACNDTLLRPPRPPAFSIVVSEPLPLPSSGAASADLRAAMQEGDSVIYVALPAGTVPGGVRTSVRNLRNGFLVQADVVDGGLDPVRLLGRVGDSLEVRVTDATGRTVVAGLRVVARRPPIIIRTVPPKGGADVPLNARIVVVFSEPMDSNSLSSGAIRLVRGGTVVPGMVALSLDGLRADVVPNDLLAPASAYTLVVGAEVADVSGDRLEEAASVSFTTGSATGGSPIASVSVTPPSVTMAAFVRDSAWYYVGGTVLLSVTARDARGNVVATPQVQFKSSDTAVAPLRGWGSGPDDVYVEAEAPGVATITATAGGISDTAVLTVLRAEITPALSSLRVGETRRFSVTVRDAAGRVQSDWRASWNVFTSTGFAAVGVRRVSSNAVDATGLRPGMDRVDVSLDRNGVLLPGGGVSGIGSYPVSVSSGAGLASVTVFPDTIRTTPRATGILLRAAVRDANGDTTYAPLTWTADPSVSPNVGQSGYVAWNEATVWPGSPGVYPVVVSAGGLSDTTIVMVSEYVVADVALWDGEVPWGSGNPSGGFCALTTSGEIFCAGDNGFPLGYGLMGAPNRGPTQMGPVGVVGGLTFSAVSASSGHRCALTVAGAAYCWGLGALGQLGASAALQNCELHTPGQFIGCSTSPVEVAGGHRFSRIATGFLHTCALDVNGAAHCWGSNEDGTLGDGTTTSRTAPTAVAGGLTFAGITTFGRDRTCALATSGIAYCWGQGASGRLGIGVAPVAVVGGQTFSTIDGNCALDVNGAAYCFEPGDTSLTAVPVAQGLAFTSIQSAALHTCGLASGGAVYCWGWYDQDPSNDDYDDLAFRAPELLPGGLAFGSLSPGGNSYYRTCGMANSGVAYCWGLLGSPLKLVGQR